MAFPAKVWGREESHGADPDTYMPAVPDTSVLGEGGTGEISARLAKSLGLPSAGEGQAGTRRAGRPRFLPQGLVPLAAGKGELIAELRPKQGRLLEPAEGSSASWGPALALLLPILPPATAVRAAVS